MVMVDQRNHGASSEVRGFHPPHSIEASAGDLLRLMDTRLSGCGPSQPFVAISSVTALKNSSCALSDSA